MTPDPSAERLESGDRAEMERVYTAEAPGLARTVRALMCRAAGVDDVVQEVFVIAFTRIETFEGRTSMSAWLRGIALNVVRNRSRRRRRRCDLDERFPARAIGAVDTPEDELDARRAEARLWNAVDQLPATQREAFVMRVLEERSLAECAEILGVSVKSVSRRALQAERVVKAAVGEDGE